MVATTIRNALDGARMVKFAETRDVFVAWHGGTTFNVYSAAGETLHETTCFNVSDEKGRPVDRETAEQHAADWLAREV